MQSKASQQLHKFEGVMEETLLSAWHDINVFFLINFSKVVDVL